MWRDSGGRAGLGLALSHHKHIMIPVPMTEKTTENSTERSILASRPAPVTLILQAKIHSYTQNNNKNKQMDAETDTE